MRILFERITQNPCEDGFDEDRFVKKLWVFDLKLYYSLYVPCSNTFLHLPNYTFFS